ncbi:hypothetical protein HELRODRAFT_176818 [Helobdella robusta]|uniref:Amino acid permease/ SLC12A domain-containing protein n=1 Tax=Helobdella robusta TaxID=6412 RepID=T1FAX9_HELRO|nr:hypothetical protein HELRODRAFT_176818 [Helobdella robusta]ESN99647.1 hypothetical protein HELRODRAFT_176818 [Helobdella robusta]
MKRDINFHPISNKQITEYAENQEGRKHSNDTLKSVVETVSLDDGKIKLKRQLGTAYAVAILVGLVVGSGVYITPQGVLKQAGSPGLSLIIWVVGGIFSLIGALVYAEIGIKFPVSGEKYIYLTEMYGPYLGFLYLAMYMLLLRPGSNSLKVLILGRYLLKPLYPDCEIPEIVIKLLATFISILICVFNCISVKFAARGQSVMTFLTILTLLLIVALGIHVNITDGGDHFKEPFQNSTFNIGNLVMAYYSTVFAYGGWAALNFLVEEIKDPKKTLPKAIVISCLLLTVLYTLVNYSYMAVLGREGVLASDAVAISLALRIWKPLAFFILAFVGARNGHLPQMISYVSISQVTPIISLALQAILIWSFVWFMNVDFIIYNVTFCAVIFDLFVVAGYIRIRYRNSKNNTDDNTLKLPLALHMTYATSLVVISFVPLVFDVLFNVSLKYRLSLFNIC